MLTRWVIRRSGGLYGCSGGLHTGRFYAVQGGYMMKKIMMFLVATNVVASRLPESRPTGTPTARAKNEDKSNMEHNHRN